MRAYCCVIIILYMSVITACLLIVEDIFWWFNCKLLSLWLNGCVIFSSSLFVCIPVIMGIY